MAQAEQYFAAEPQSKDVRKTLHVTLRGNEADVEVSNGVFSGNRVDLGMMTVPSSPTRLMNLAKVASISSIPE